MSECKLPPPGWWCSREAPHDGPCAARPKEETVILVDGEGRPIERPRREDFASDLEFVCAFHAWRDRVTGAANRAFDAAFRRQ